MIRRDGPRPPDRRFGATPGEGRIAPILLIAAVLLAGLGVFWER